MHTWNSGRLLLVALMASGSLFAQTRSYGWQYITSAEDGSELHYASTKTTQERAGVLRGWFKITHPATDSRIVYTMSLNEFNCAHATMRHLRSVVSFRNGRSTSSNDTGTWEHPDRDSLGHVELQTICSDGELKYIGATGGASFYYSPSRTIRKEAGVIRTWDRFIFSPDYKYSSMMCLVEFDCEEGAFRILQCNHYKRNGSAEQSDSSQQSSDWLYPPPNSVIDDLRKSLCAVKTN